MRLSSNRRIRALDLAALSRRDCPTGIAQRAHLDSPAQAQEFRAPQALEGRLLQITLGRPAAVKLGQLFVHPLNDDVVSSIAALSMKVLKPVL